MAILIVSEFRLRPERVEDVVRLAADRFSRDGRELRQRRSASLFQSAEDPTDLTYFGHWGDRAAFEAAQQRDPQFGAPDWYLDAPRTTFYAPLGSFTRMLLPCGAASLALVAGPPAVAGAGRGLLIAFHRDLQAAEHGIVEYQLGEWHDAPSRFLIFARWRDDRARAAYLAGAGAALVDALATLGLIIRRYEGHRRAAVSEAAETAAPSE